MLCRASSQAIFDARAGKSTKYSYYSYICTQNTEIVVIPPGDLCLTGAPIRQCSKAHYKTVAPASPTAYLFAPPRARPNSQALDRDRESSFSPCSADH